MRSPKSKLDSVALWDYAMLLLDKRIGRFVPLRLLAFSIVGVMGAAVHIAVLALLLQFHLTFAKGQAIATLCAMTFNFAVNNIFTYRDRRLRGSRWLRGWASFALACGVGSLANVCVATFIYRTDPAWVPAAIAGVIVGAAWNYAVTGIFTWGRFRTVVGRDTTDFNRMVSHELTLRPAPHVPEHVS